MLSSEAAAPTTTSSRNPRRRYRNTSTDSQAAQKAKKKQRRSSVLPDTFLPPGDESQPNKSGRRSHDKKASHQGTPAVGADEVARETANLTLRSRAGRKGDRMVNFDGDRIVVVRMPLPLHGL